MNTPSLRLQFGKLARRSIARTLRQPVVYVPNLVFPLFLLAVVSAAGDRVTAIKGFPTDNYTAFVLGGMMVQSAAGATTMAGVAFGQDIESGFLSRLAMTKVRGSALIAAQLAGVAVLGVVQAALVLGVGLAAGASLKAGVGGAAVLIAFVVLVILAFGAMGMLVAVLTGRADRVHPLFSLTLGLLFMSSMAMPRNLIQEDWFKAIATYNPISYPIEAARSLFITGWDGEALALGCAIAGIGLILAVTASVATLRRRIVAR
jgi:ABC-2 type transport system permease protein